MGADESLPLRTVSPEQIRQAKAAAAAADDLDTFLDETAKRCDAQVQARAERAEALLEAAQKQIDGLTAALTKARAEVQQRRTREAERAAVDRAAEQVRKGDDR